MSSEYYKCKEKLSITDIEIGENEQIANFDVIDDILVKKEAPEIKPFIKYENEQNSSGNEFDAIPILKEEIVEEDINETKLFSEYGVFNDCPEKNEDSFYDPDSSEFEVTLRNCFEDLKESKFSPTHTWDNMACNGLVGELAKPLVSHYNEGVTLKNEDEGHSKCIDNSSTNSVELKTETLKTECDIDIIYEDVKPRICEEKSSGKNENESYSNCITDISIRTEIGPTFSRDFKSWLQQNKEEYGTAMKRANDTRKYQKCYPLEITHMEEKPFQCKVCLKSFSRKDHCTEHEINHTGGKRFECNICLKLFSWKNNLREHERVHTGEKPFQCKVCPKSFAYERKLLRHMRMHSGEKPFQCKFCSKSFTEEWILTTHERIHTGEKPFQCKICSRSFARKWDLTLHEKMHTGDKPFKCKICLKLFSRKANLMKHERVHKGDKPFQCKICSKSFFQKGHLTEHEIVHSGRKPFECKICLKLFSRKTNLTKHERIHTGDKKFQCKICSKSFFQKVHLTEHEIVHTGEKPFECKICLKLFSRRNNLTKHERVHKGDREIDTLLISSGLITKT